MISLTYIQILLQQAQKHLENISSIVHGFWTQPPAPNCIFWLGPQQMWWGYWTSGKAGHTVQAIASTVIILCNMRKVHLGFQAKLYSDPLLRLKQTCGCLLILWDLGKDSYPINQKHGPLHTRSGHIPCLLWHVKTMTISVTMLESPVLDIMNKRRLSLYTMVLILNQLLPHVEIRAWLCGTCRNMGIKLYALRKVIQLPSWTASS